MTLMRGNGEYSELMQDLRMNWAWIVKQNLKFKFPENVEKINGFFEFE